MFSCDYSKFMKFWLQFAPFTENNLYFISNFFNKNTIIFWHDFFGWLFRKMVQGLGLFGPYPVAMIFTVCVWVLTSGSTFPKDSLSFENCGSQLFCGRNKPFWLLCCGTQMSTWFKTCNTHYINQGWREGINQSISFYNFRKLRRRSRCEGSSDPPRESTFQVES